MEYAQQGNSAVCSRLRVSHVPFGNRALLSAVHREVEGEEKEREAPEPNTPGLKLSIVLRSI